MRSVICLHTFTVFRLGGGNSSHSYGIYVHVVHDFRQTEIYIAGPLVPNSSASEV